MDSESWEVSNEYYQLWDELISQYRETLPDIIEQGLATVREKISLDDIGEVCEGHDEIFTMRCQIEEADKEYISMLIESKRGGVTQCDSNEWVSRAADFLQGVIVALQRDYTEDPKLNFLVQQLYLAQR